jgi:hypothetical protein
MVRQYQVTRGINRLTSTIDDFASRAGRFPVFGVAFDS